MSSGNSDKVPSDKGDIVNPLTPVISKSYVVSPYISLWEFVWGIEYQELNFNTWFLLF